MIKKTILHSVLIVLAATLAQETRAQEFAFDHAALSVTDVEVSREFYEDLFGMTNITDRDPIEGVRWLKMQGGGELHLLAIVEGEVTTNQAVHLAVRTPDFDNLLAKIVEMDIDYTTWLGEGPGVTERDDGTRQIYLKDPDGYWIEVIGTVD